MAAKEVELEKTSSNFEALHRDYQMIKRDCQTIQRESESAVTSKQGMIDSIAGELDGYAEKLRNSETESKSLRITIEQLQNVVDGYETRESAFQKNISRIDTESKDQVQQLQKALGTERDSHQSLKHAFESQQQTIQGFTSTITSKNSYIARLEENVRHYQTEHERLVAQLEEVKLLKKEVKQCNDKETKLKTIIDDHKRYMEQQAAQISALRSESKSMLQARDQLAAERDDAVFKITQLEERIHKLQVLIREKNKMYIVLI